jgi:ribonuclease HI
MKTFYTDGGSRNNGQRGNQVAVICVADARSQPIIFEEIGDKTNNQAELTAILRCLQLPHDGPIKIISDSQLAVNLVNRAWKTKLPHLAVILTGIWRTPTPYKLVWQPRETNRAGHLIEEQYGL